MSTRRLPDFDRPPVIETVLGMQFDRLKSFRNGHLGVFWKRLGPDWPHSSDAGPLNDQFERFGAELAWGPPELRLELLEQIPQRIQVRNVARDRMVQLQNGRLLYNWLSSASGQYPRYAAIRPELDQLLGNLRELLAEENLGQLTPNQWEVTYVNRIPRGTVWEEPGDWVQLFRCPVALPQALSGLALESGSASWQHEIPKRLGRLHVQLSHLSEMTSEPTEFLLLTLTARGPVGKERGSGLTWEQGVDLGHETIVTAFHDMTSEEAHRYWGVKHA